MDKRKIKKSKEDYLEAILIRINKYGACRVTDIAEQMGYSKASTSVALKKLEEEGCIIKDDWRVLLTDQGYAIASRIYERHNFFLEWFQCIGISKDIAESDACMIEHVISDESFEKIKEYLNQVREK